MGFFDDGSPDLDYQYVENEKKVQELLSRYPGCDEICAICQRADDVLTGPFVNVKVITDPVYFHRNCIELSQFSYYRLNDNKWVNISDAL